MGKSVTEALEIIGGQGVLLMMLFLTGLYGAYKLAEEINGDSQYDRMMDEADRIVRRANARAEIIIRQAHLEAAHIREQALADAAGKKEEKQ